MFISELRLSMLCLASFWIAATCTAETIWPGPGLGRLAAPVEIAAWDVDIATDGAGLPPGQGVAETGALIYANRCVACHGPEGIGASADDLAGASEPLTSEWPDKTIGTYWPYASTLFDFIRRAMPMDAPGSLQDDEVYALSAYLLYLNGIIGESQVMDAASLPGVVMPNRDGFIPYYPESEPLRPAR